MLDATTHSGAPSALSASHRLAMAVLGARDAAQLLDALSAELQRALQLDAVRLWAVGEEADEHVAQVVATARPLDSGALYVPIAWSGSVRHVAALSAARPLGPGEVMLAETLAAQAAAGLALLDADERRAERNQHDRSLARAARALNVSVGLREALAALATEAAGAVSGEAAEIDLGDSPAPEGAVSVPLTWDDEVRGALWVRFPDGRTPDEEDLRVLEAMADLAVVGCRNAEAYERLQEAARTDALTGLLNHGAMQVRVREEIARARRDEDALSCVIIDLDDFKRVNDLRGHQAGDEYLRRVADHLRAEVRPYDVVARYGGDEFVLLLPETEEDEALHVAERVRDRLREGEPEEGPGGGCSIGVAEWVDGMTADALLELADRALLWAKRTGKARVAVVNPEVEVELARLHRENGSPAAVQALAAAIEARDNYTAEHSEQVVALAKGVAMILGMPADMVERIGAGALLHDIGKLAIPNEILQKAGGLTAGEWAIIAEHPLIGERILRRTPQLAGLAPVVRHEHEHWDGTGYPDGLMGHRIPLASRIILACDAYIAMITPRPYRPALTRQQAVAELNAQAGSQFDPAVVEALLDRLGVSPRAASAS